MATPKGTRAQRFLLKSGDAVHIYSNSQSITLQMRYEVPTEVDVAATSFKASVVLGPGDALSPREVGVRGKGAARPRGATIPGGLASSGNVEEPKFEPPYVGSYIFRKFSKRLEPARVGLPPGCLIQSRSRSWATHCSRCCRR